LSVATDVDVTRVWLDGFIYHPIIGQDFRSVRFLVDTGADRTTILQGNALSLQIDFSKLTKAKNKTVGVGGSPDVYEIEDVVIGFEDENTKKPILINLKTLHVLKPNKKIKNPLTFTLFGTDLLSLFQFNYDLPVVTLRLKKKYHKFIKTNKK